MVMQSWLGEDASAIWGQEDEERRKQQEAQSQLAQQPVPTLPAQPPSEPEPGLPQAPNPTHDLGWEMRSLGVTPPGEFPPWTAYPQQSALQQGMSAGQQFAGAGLPNLADISNQLTYRPHAEGDVNALGSAYTFTTDPTDPNYRNVALVPQMNTPPGAPQTAEHEALHYYYAGLPPDQQSQLNDITTRALGPDRYEAQARLADPRDYESHRFIQAVQHEGQRGSGLAQMSPELLAYLQANQAPGFIPQPPAPPSQPQGVSQNLDLPSMTQAPDQNAWWTSPTAQNLLSAPAISADLPTPAQNYTANYGPPNVFQQQAEQQVQNFANQGNGPLGIGNLSPGDVANGLGSVPLLGPAGYGLQAAGIDTPTWGDAAQQGMNAYNTRIPGVSDFMEQQVKPVAGQIGTLGGAYLDPLGIGSGISGQLGGPSAQQVGQYAGEGLVPVTAGDFALNALAAPEGAGLLERATGLPLDDAFRGAGRSLQNYATDYLHPGIFAPEALGGREAATVQLRDGIPTGAASEIDPFKGSPTANSWVRYNSAPVPPVEGTIPYPLPVDPLDPIAMARSRGEPNVTPPMHPNGGELVFGQGVNGGNLPIPPATQPEDVMGALRQSIEAKGGTPPPAEVAPPLQQEITRESVGMDRHVLSLPDGSRSEWRGYPNGDAHLLDTTVMQERHGTGTTLRENALTDIYTQNPAARVTADFNSEGGVRLFDRGAEPGQAHYYDRPGGTEISKEDAIARTQSGQGAVGEMAPPSPDRLQQLGINLQQPTSEQFAQVLDQTKRDVGIPDAADQAAREAYTQQNPIGVANPPGTGRQLIDDVIANNPGLTQAQQDFLRSPNGQAAATQREAAGNAGRPYSETGGVGGGGTRPPRGNDEMPRGSGYSVNPPAKPEANGLFHKVMDVLYAPFGGDLSSVLRQDVMRMANPLRAGESLDVLKDMKTALVSHDAAVQLTQDLRQRAEALVPQPHFSDWQGGAFTGREAMYSDLLNKIPGYEALNRGFATEINSRRVNAIERFANGHPDATPALLQTEWNRLERTTGRGSLGSGSVEKALSTAGPMFTSLRFAASIPQRTASLLPWTRLTDGSVQMFGPVWQEAVKDHAGFAGTVITALAAAQQAGLKVGWDPTNQTSSSGGKVPFLSIQLPNGSFIDPTGGAKQYINTILQVASGQKNGKDYPALLDMTGGAYKGSIAEFVRNKTGPLPQAIAAGLKEAGVHGSAIDFMRPDYWDKGVTGKGNFADRVAQFVVPLWIQDVAQAVKNSAKGEQLPSQVAAGAASFLGAGVQTYDRNPLTDLRDAAKNDPALPAPVKGVDYKDLGPDGKAAVDKVVEQQNPDALKQAKDEAAKNANPVLTEHKATVDKIDSEADQRKSDLYERLRNGSLSPDVVRQGREVIDSAARAKKDAAQTDPKFKEAISGFEQNEVGKALAAYYAIPEHYTKPDGKIDWDMVHQKQNEFIKFVGDTDRKTANLLLYEVQTQKPTTNSLDRLYEVAQPTVTHYFGDVKDVTQRTNERRANPKDDALLNLLGYESKTLTPQAATMLQQMRSTLPAAQAPAPVAASAGAAPAPVQRSEAPAPPPAPPPMQPSSAIGPDGRTVAQIAGTNYKSDAERNFYFESRGLSVPKAGQQPQSTASLPGGTGSAFEMDKNGRTGSVRAEDIAPYAERYGVRPGPLALLMNHEGNGAHDTSEPGVQPARWGIVQTTAKENHIQDTRSMTPQQAYDIAAKYIATGLEKNQGDEAKAYATYFLGQGNLTGYTDNKGVYHQGAVEMPGDWVKNADKIAYDITFNGKHVYGDTAMSDYLRYLGLR